MADLLEKRLGYTPPVYAAPLRAERLIAGARIVLATVSLFAVWLDPSTPANVALLTYFLLGLYIVYAVILAVIVWRSRTPRPRLRLTTHVADLIVFSVFIVLTEGPVSPFFAYFTFSLVCATMRWQWRGALWTTAAALTAFNAIGVYALLSIENPGFELDRLIIRNGYLVVVATLLGYLGVYEQRLRNEMARLADWPRDFLTDVNDHLRSVLAGAGAVLDAPRVLVVWDDPAEPWRYIALWADGRYDSWRSSPDTHEPVVPHELANSAFVSWASTAQVVLRVAPDDIRTWRGDPIHPDLRSRFAIRHVLHVRLLGNRTDGHLFGLDNARWSADDLVLGEVVGRHVTASMDYFFLSRSLQQNAATEERIRLARNLHDGVLQSLTGAALQVKTVQQLVDGDAGAARKRLSEIQQLIEREQRDLRFFVRELRPAPVTPQEGRDALDANLEEMAQRIESVWGLKVHRSLDLIDDRLAASLGEAIYWIAREALVNAARHADATEARLTVGKRDDGIHIVVADNGCGFPFRGRYNHGTLMTSRLGPVSLKERVASLDGTVTIESNEAGARLDIRLPLPRDS